MKIAFYSQELLKIKKTGIGCTIESILKALPNEKKYSYQIDYFKQGYKKETIETFEKNTEGIVKNSCSWFNDVIYRKIWNFIPLAYSLFFGGKNDITQFFNYYIPPGVKGKKVTIIYDMTYKAYPETVRKKTLYFLNSNIKKACKRADKIITISEFSKKEIIKYLNIKEDKIAIMPCGVDLKKYHTHYSLVKVEAVKKKYNIANQYILYLGTLEPRKNIERIIDAYYLLKKEKENIPYLVLAGKKGWMYEKIFEKVCKYEMEQNIIFTGYIEDEDVPLLISGAKIFIFPSIYEGFGIPPLEAMACGIPVITSNAASLPEVVGDAAIKVNPYSIKEIFEAMEKLLTDIILQDKLKEAGLKRVEQFTWENSAIRLLKIYESLL